MEKVVGTNKKTCFHGPDDCDVDSNCVGTLKWQANGGGNCNEFYSEGPDAIECCEDSWGRILTHLYDEVISKINE